MSGRVRRFIAVSLVSIGLVVSGGLTAPARAQEGAGAQERGARESSDSWRVATKESPPFAFRDDDQRWRGLSIDLAKHLAERMNAELEFVDCETVPELLQTLRAGEADAAIAALSVTAEREREFDFSYPYFQAGPGVAVRTVHGGNEFSRVVGGLMSPAFLQLLAGVIVLLLACGVLFWAVEKRAHPDYRDVKKRKGIGTGMWWSTLIFLGHKGIYPKTVTGCVIAATGMIASILLLSVLTGAIASILTVGQLAHPIQDVSDLQKVRTVSIENTSSATFLRDERVQFRTVESVEAGLAAVSSGDADAFVYDAPLLEYVVGQSFDDLRVIETPLEVEDYAIAFPLDSPWRKRVNRALLESRSEEIWEEIRYRYLGK